MHLRIGLAAGYLPVEIECGCISPIRHDVIQTISAVVIRKHIVDFLGVGIPLPFAKVSQAKRQDEVSGEYHQHAGDGPAGDLPAGHRRRGSGREKE